jgi:hypothetical protein
MSKKTNCTFTSVWDDGSVVTTPCIYHEDTGEVEPEVSEGTIPTGMVTREYISLDNGDEIEVCLDCHSYTLKTAVGDLADCSYGEYRVCSDDECCCN